MLPPASRTIATASALNSSVNRRRRRPLPVLDMDTPFRAHALNVGVRQTGATSPPAWGPSPHLVSSRAEVGEDGFGKWGPRFDAHRSPCPHVGRRAEPAMSRTR